MVYTAATVAIPTSLVAKAIKSSSLNEPNGLRRSHSVKDIRVVKARMRRSFSDNHICYAINRVRAEQKSTSSQSFGIFPFQLSSSIIPKAVRSFLFDSETSNDMDTLETSNNCEEDENWMERVLEIRSLWRNKQLSEDGDMEGASSDDHEDGSECSDCNCDEEEEEGGCEACHGSEDERMGEKESYDRQSFSKLLTQVPLSDTKLYSMLAFLCNIAYKIPQIKAYDLRGHYGLEFITSSLEKKAEAEALKAKLDQDSICMPVLVDSESKQKRWFHPDIAYEIAASAASYVPSRAKDLLSLSSQSDHETNINGSEAAACMAASTMTSVVAAREEEKQKAASDLQSLHSSPCEWFICDDTSTYTRCFVIQGSDSLAAWQANLFFEPTQFEGMDVLVHRGIYEAAKGMYEQFLPEILDHLNRYGDRAKFQFTGHSLGGSLALLVHLMLVARKLVKPSTLRPVVTFGSPFVFCGGQKMLLELGLDESHVHCVMMHRDIVPRAFSCTYPDHVATVLKRIQSFSSHPCLTKNKLLYSPMGKILILQPDEKSSPPHPLLPPGIALHTLEESVSGSSGCALQEFLNNPHPLNTLSDPAAYGKHGSILRDHKSSNYVKSIQGVLRHHRKRLVVPKETKQRNLTWPLLASPSPYSWSHDRTLVHRTLVHSSRLLNKKVLVTVI